MKLAIEKRMGGNKGANNQLRRSGYIPAILYGVNQPGIPIRVKAEEIHSILRGLKAGLLATTLFELQEGQKTYKALVKEVQYHVASYEIEHIDFVLVADDRPVTVKVPIQMAGAADCVGVKLGGFLRQVVRSLKVSCLPKSIPQELIVDVRDLNIAQSKTLADIPLPDNVRPLAKMSEVAVIVGKKAGS